MGAAWGSKKAMQASMQVTFDQRQQWQWRTMAAFRSMAKHSHSISVEAAFTSKVIAVVEVVGEEATLGQWRYMAASLIRKHMLFLAHKEASSM